MDQQSDNTQEKWKQTGFNILGFAAFCLVGLSSWLVVNGLFVELPYFISASPEGNLIASQISLIIQLCNIFPLIYVFIYSYFPSVPNSYRVSIGLMISAGFLTSIFLGLLWNVNIEKHSIFLLLLSACAGTIGCLSVVIYYPFASKYSPFLTSAISVGSGLTGFVTSILGAIQIATNMSVSQFFYLLAAFFILSLIGFLSTFFKQIAVVCHRYITFDGLGTVSEAPNEPVFKMKRLGYILMCNQFLICFVYYFLLGAVPYVAPESFTDPTTSTVQEYMFVGGMMFGSVGRFLCTFQMFRSSNEIFIFLCTGFQYILAFLICSQCSLVWIPQNWIWTVIIMYILFSGVNGYQDTLLYQVAASVHKEPKFIERLTRFVGLSNQFGAFLGSLTIFVLVHVFA